MEKQTTINQHYVPRFYMKNFSEVKNEETNKEKALISFYQFDKMIYIEKIPTKSICCEKYFFMMKMDILKINSLKKRVFGQNRQLKLKIIKTFQNQI